MGLGSRSSGPPGFRDRLRRHLAVTIVAGAGSALAVAAFFGALRGESERARSRFGAAAAISASSVRGRFEGQLGVVQSIGDLFHASRSVEPEEFARFVRDAMGRNPEILQLEWLPRVDRGQLPAILESGRREGLGPDFRVVEIAEGGRAVAAESQLVRALGRFRQAVGPPRTGATSDRPEPTRGVGAGIIPEDGPGMIRRDPR